MSSTVSPLIFRGSAARPSVVNLRLVNVGRRRQCVYRIASSEQFKCKMFGAGVLPPESCAHASVEWFPPVGTTDGTLTVDYVYTSFGVDQPRVTSFATVWRAAEEQSRHTTVLPTCLLRGTDCVPMQSTLTFDDGEATPDFAKQECRVRLDDGVVQQLRRGQSREELCKELAERGISMDKSDVVESPSYALPLDARPVIRSGVSEIFRVSPIIHATTIHHSTHSCSVYGDTDTSSLTRASLLLSMCLVAVILYWSLHICVHFTVQLPL